MNGIKSKTCLQALCLYILFVIVGCGNKSDKPLSKEQVIDFIKDNAKTGEIDHPWPI